MKYTKLLQNIINFVKFGHFIPALAGFQSTSQVSESVCVRNHETTAGESKMNMVPPFSDGPGSISLAWGTHADNFEPGTRCESRVLGSQLWHD